MRRMEVSRLRSYQFLNTDGMVELNLSCQNLRVLPAEVFECTKIQVLKLDRNKLNEIPKTMSSMRQLRILQASNNFLMGIPETIVNCTYLTELNLENNRISSLPVNLGLLCNLKILKLGENELENLTNEIGFLESLKNLDLHGNKLWYVPFSLGNLNKLHQLNLSDNLFEHLPMPVCRIRSLVVLNLSGNHLISLAPDFENLRNLKELNLSMNRLKVVPPTVCQSKELRYLNLAANQLTELPQQLSKLSKLQVLHAQQNYLEGLPEALGNLRYLNVAQNSLHNFSVGGMKRLKYLNASKNLLENTPMALFNLTKLEHLKLNSNRITFLSQDIVLLKNLKTLDLGNNRLTNLPQVINELEHLNFFNVQGNSVNTRLHPIIAEEGQRQFGLSARSPDSTGHRKMKPQGYGTIAGSHSLHDNRHGPCNFGGSRTLGPSTGMWTHEELLQDGFSPQLVTDSQSCVIVHNNNDQTTDDKFPEPFGDEEKHENLGSSRQIDVKGRNPSWFDSIRGKKSSFAKGKGSYSLRQHFKGRFSKRSKRTTQEEREANSKVDMNLKLKSDPTAITQNTEQHTNLDQVLSQSMESLSSTDFKLLGVCSQLEAMLNEELLHPVLQHPSSLSKSFKKKTIIKAPNGLWRLSQNEGPSFLTSEIENSKNKHCHSDTLRLQSPSPTRTRLVNGHSRDVRLSPPPRFTKQREPLPLEAWGTNFQPIGDSDVHFEQPVQEIPNSTAGRWEIPLSPQQSRNKQKIFQTVSARSGIHSSSLLRPTSRQFQAEGSLSRFSPPGLTRSYIDRFLLSHQGRTCVSSVDPKVIILVPKNGASRPVYMMMQLEKIHEDTIEYGRKRHELVANIVSMGPILHLSTSDPVDCHGMVTMTLPVAPAGKKGKLHLLTVRADNSCIPCTAGFHMKNGYLTLQACHLSGKVAVYTWSKCKYKACKSVEQLLQFHYI